MNELQMPSVAAMCSPVHGADRVLGRLRMEKFLWSLRMEQLL